MNKPQTRFGWFQDLKPKEQTYWAQRARDVGVGKIIIRLRKKAKEQPHVEKQYVEELKQHFLEKRM